MCCRPGTCVPSARRVRDRIKDGGTVRVQSTPALCTFKFHSVEPHGFSCHALDVDFEEYLFAFEEVEGRWGFRGVDFSLGRQGIDELSQSSSDPQHTRTQKEKEKKER